MTDRDVARREAEKGNNILASTVGNPDRLPRAVVECERAARAAEAAATRAGFIVGMVPNDIVARQAAAEAREDAKLARQTATWAMNRAIEGY